MVEIPQINLNGMDNPTRRSNIVQEIADACRRFGFFQVIDHGIALEVLDRALSVSSSFFDLPDEDKAVIMSNDVYEPVRYCTSVRNGSDRVQYRRVFLKHYANPLQDWIKLWPNSPSDYREKMGEYVVPVQTLAIKIMSAITEGLKLDPNYSTENLKNGMQVIAVNHYPSCPKPELTLGLPPHSDYSCISVVHQDSLGLQILDREDESWKTVPVIRGALQVHVGDHLEVLTNGRYKSVVHRVFVGKEKPRLSIASLHGLGMEVKMRPADELVEEDDRMSKYRESSFADFLDFITKNDVTEGKSFLSTLKIADH